MARPQARHYNSPWPTSAELRAQLAQEHDGTLLLSFSCGKDAMATWLALREHFTRIVPVYCYLVPDLSFVDESLRYFEDVFETPIVRLPHPTLYRWLVAGCFQPPHRLPAIDALDFPLFTWDDVFHVVREDQGLPDTTLSALGVRASDSLARHTAMKRFGPVNRTRQLCYPIYDWSVQQCRDAIAHAGLRYPIDYRWFGRSFDGLDPRFLTAIREHAPADYDRIRTWFPLADVLLHRLALTDPADALAA